MTTIGTTLCAAVGATAAGMILVAPSAPAADPAPATEKTTLTVFEPFDAGVTEEIDIGDDGFGPGDLILEHHRLLGSEGQLVGRLARQLQVISVHPSGDFRFFVHVHARLPGGTITYSGTTTFAAVDAGTAVLPLTGGTGAYAPGEGKVRAELGVEDGHEGVFLTFVVDK